MASFTPNILNYQRLITEKVSIGGIEMGGGLPVVIQTMVTADTMDTDSVVQEIKDVVSAGAQLVRITTPSRKESANLERIKQQLQLEGINTPLVADVHYTPHAAEEAALHVEKIRINPGNFAERKNTHQFLTDKDYNDHLSFIEEKLLPLLSICKAKNRTLRIGVNHGSLSERILNRYGDTPEGMVHSAMEYIQLCEKHQFFSIVVSMKSSNPLVMIQANRLLVQTMQEYGRCYPIHLGVTEAGDGEDGRIKSAIGIGSLLEDGIGDTIRVSLTEPAVNEIPVARSILNRYLNYDKEKRPTKHTSLQFDPFTYNRRKSHAISGVGGNQVPVVMMDLLHHTELKPAHLFGCGYRYDVDLDKWHSDEFTPDILYINHLPDFSLPQQITIVLPYNVWTALEHQPKNYWPALTWNEYKKIDKTKLVETNFILKIESALLTELEELELTHLPENTILLYSISTKKPVHQTRAFFGLLQRLQLTNPVILHRAFSESNFEEFTIQSAIDFGAILIDGFGDGIYQKTGNQPVQHIRKTSFGILQASRTRISKTEYISCPSCGRTLFDLTETTARIKAATAHLKGVKIGIMGCIVNGPGEMADADYGYVGSGPGKINLYKAKELVKRNIPEKEAVHELINLIKQHGDWRDEPNNN
jgi:(E)-4-hydroxy-3-methylbut-2-enyl-diphosphate synthase